MNRRYEYLVIGNGLIGSAAGRHLAARSASVAVVGPAEPIDHRTHDGVFASHYDQGRLVSALSRDPVWSVIVGRAIARYHGLEQASGVRFHHPVGTLQVSRPSITERQEIKRWLAEVAERDGGDAGHRYFEPGDGSWRRDFPFLSFPDDYGVLVQAAPSGYINPVQLIQAQNSVAAANGAEIIERRVTEVHSTSTGVEVGTADGERFAADKVLVAAGAFTNFGGLVPEPIPLRLKTESMVWATVSDDTARTLATMPTVGYDVEHPEIDDPYMAPPVRYPDGTWKIKMGCNTRSELWPTTLEETQNWFRTGDSDADLGAMTEVLQAQLPEVEFLDVSTHRCIVTYTPSRYPTIDVAPGEPHGRLFVATGGNGTAAQGSDTLGGLAADLLVGEPWPSDLPRPLFLGSNGWNPPDGGTAISSDVAAGRRNSKAQQRAARPDRSGPEPG